MGLIPYTGFVGGAYRARASNFDAEECLNLFPVAAEVGSARNVAALYGTPGLSLWATLGGGTIRGMLRFDSDSLFAVSGRNVYRITAAGVPTLIGLIDVGLMPVSMATNGTSVVIATNPNMYIIDVATDVVTQMVDPDFEGAGQVGFLGGYYVWNVPGTGRMQYSDLYSTNVDPLSFFTAEGAPDILVGIIVDHLELWALGERTTEVYTITGDPDQPLQRINGAYIEHGMAAAYSVAKMDNTIYWLGSDDNGQGMVWKATGAYEPQRVSTHPIEYAMAQTADLSTAVAWTYQQEGHAFYVLSVGDRTWCLDASTGLWHERAWRDEANGLHRHRGNCQQAFAGKTIVGDWESGNLYVMSLDVYTDNGSPIVARRAGPFVSARTYHMLQIDFEAGVGLSEGQGSDPQAMLQWSDDGGKTWSSEHWASMGRMGEYQRRVRWRRLGTPRRYGLPRVFRVTVTDPVRRAIVGAMMDVGA